MFIRYLVSTHLSTPDQLRWISAQVGAVGPEGMIMVCYRRSPPVKLLPGRGAWF